MTKTHTNQDGTQVEVTTYGTVKTLSFGERMVRTTFNPSASSEVDKIKMAFAAILNELDALRSSTTDNEVKRWISEAITLAETSAMFSVKAYTQTK